MPRSPGPLIDPASLAPGRSRDEIDDAIDELFGSDPGGTAGKMDVALLVGGGALLLWSLLGLHSTFLTVLGAILLVLGTVPPARALWHRITEGRLARRRRSVSFDGLALDVTHPLTRELATAYEQLLAAAARPGAPLRSEAVSAGHLALTESAALLGGAGPANAAESEYVERRVAAIRDLAAEIERHNRLAAEGEQTAGDEEQALQRAARAAAGDELDATGLSSLRELDELKRALAAEPDD